MQQKAIYKQGQSISSQPIMDNNIQNKAQNLVTYQKPIKSNNQVFQQSVQNPNYRYTTSQKQGNMVSPGKSMGQKKNLGYAQTRGQPHQVANSSTIPHGINPQDQQISQNSAGHHRRSKTDGTVQNLLQKNPKGSANQKAQYQIQLGQQNQMSRQQNVNSNLNQFDNKNSNQSAKSAHIQLNKAYQVSKPLSGHGSLSVEQAAKNLKFINSNQDNMAATRNSNLQSQPNKDKMAHQVLNEPTGSSSNEINLQAEEKFIPPETFEIAQDNFEIDQNNVSGLSDMSGVSQHNNISVEQLKELMKIPQIAQFLKEQIEIQQRNNKGTQNLQEIKTTLTNQQQKNSRQQAQNSQSYKNSNQSKKSKNQDTNSVPQIKNVTASTTTGQAMTQALKCNESNMNSDTSQEILRYQKEWAKQFNEQVNPQIQSHQQPQQQKQGIYGFQQNFDDNTEIKSGGGGIPAGRNSSGITGGDSSQMMVINQEGSQELIAHLPLTTPMVNMNNLNSGVPKNQIPQIVDPEQIIKQNQNKINFYQRVDTDISNGQTQALIDQGNPVEMTPSDKEFAPQPEYNFVPQDESKSRNNILNDGRQLSLITVCSDILDTSAELIQDNIRENSQDSQKDEEDEYLTFQLCEGEEMNNEMANFIGIHMLNDGYIEGEEPQDKNEQEGGLTYQCPKSGSHFEFIDLIGRMRNLKQKRNVIDEAIQQEDERQKAIRQQQQAEISKQKQLQKQKKLKSQVKNIIQKGLQEASDDNLNDSIKHDQLMMTDEDVLILEDEAHLQTHHVTTNVRQRAQQEAENMRNNVSSNGHKQQSKIYNTHDGRLKQKVDDTQNQNNLRPQYQGQQQNTQQSFNQNNNHSSSLSKRQNPTQQKQSKQPQPMHQASSLASNHASKISNISKSYHVQQNQLSIPRSDDNQKHVTENESVSPQIIGSKAQQFQQEIHFNTMGLTQAPGGQTVLHSNALSSMVNTGGQNTYQYNTAIGSSRGNKTVDKNSNQRNSKKNNLNHKQQFSEGNMNSAHLKQTANFGPQMNLIKSQIPKQNQQQQQMHQKTAQKQGQHQKIKSVEMRSKQFQIQQAPIHMQHQTHGSQGARGLVAPNTVIHTTDKRKPMKNPQMGHHGKSNMPQQLQGHHIQQQPNGGQIGLSPSLQTNQMNSKIKNQQMKQSNQANIYNTQQHRKSKLINTGGNMLGYDMSRGATVNSSANQNMYQSYYNQNNVNTNSNSMGRSDNNQMHLNQIDMKNQTNHQQVYQQANSAGNGSIPPSMKGNQQNLQSYSFDYRKPQTTKLQPASTGGYQDSSNKSHIKQNMRTFDNHPSQQQQNIQFQVQGQQNAHQSLVRNHHGSIIINTQPATIAGALNTNKQKSSSLSNPKDSLNNPSQQQPSTICIGYDENPSNYRNPKKVKSTQNQVYSNQIVSSAIDSKGYQKKRQQKIIVGADNRIAYNSAGSFQEPQSHQKVYGQQQQTQKQQKVQKQYTVFDSQEYEAAQGMIMHSDVNTSFVVDNDKQQVQHNSKVVTQQSKQVKKIIQGLAPTESQRPDRITASTRGINSGTNARVNTFDNRGIQATQKQNIQPQSNQYHQQQQVRHPSQQKILLMQQQLPDQQAQSHNRGNNQIQNYAQYNQSKQRPSKIQY